MSVSLEARIAALREMPANALRAQYRELFGEESRSGNRQFLFRRVAWRLQALAEGDLSERARNKALELANDADLKLVGLGTVDAEAQLVLSGLVEPGEIEDIAAAGGVGEILGHFFNADGQILDTALTGRTLSASFPTTTKERLVALAGGQAKVAAIRAILRSRRLHGLITDERTARALLA